MPQDRYVSVIEAIHRHVSSWQILLQKSVDGFGEQ
jgi:hypothetical protein